MHNRPRPRNYFLVLTFLTTIILFIFACYQTIKGFKEVKFENFYLELSIIIVQFTLYIYGLFGLVFLFNRARMRSCGYNSEAWNRFQMKLFGALAIIFSTLAIIITVLYSNNFPLLFFASILSAFIAIVIWQREQNIKSFVECVLHANTMSNSHVNEQNARDLYKLRECDKDFVILVQSCQKLNNQLSLNIICHSEYYHIQKWLKLLGDVLEGKVERDTLIDLHREMAKRSEIFELNSNYERRYQQLAAMSHLILPAEKDQEDKQMIRDSSFFIHNNPNTTV